MARGQEVKVLPEEKDALEKVRKVVQMMIANGSIDFIVILKLIQQKKVFINQIATELYNITKQYLKEKNVVQLIFLIDYICKSDLKDFKIAIKSYIVKLFVKVYQNQKEFGCDLLKLKTVFKSWFHIFPLPTLIEISNKVQQELKEDLDFLPNEKLEELKKFYKSLNVSGYEPFLNGTYKRPAGTKRPMEDQVVKKVKPEQKYQQTQRINLDAQQQQQQQKQINQPQIQQTQQSHQQVHPYQQTIQNIQNQNNQTFASQQFRNLQPSQIITSAPSNSLSTNYPYLNPYYYNQFPQIPQATNLSHPLSQPTPQQQQQPQQQRQPQQPLNKNNMPFTQINQSQASQQGNIQQQQQQQQQYQQQQQQQQLSLNNQKQLNIPIDPNSTTTVFGSLFQYFSEQLQIKHDLINKEAVKDFLKKQIPSSELLSNPNRYGTLIKCPTCFMRFRNQSAYIQHLNNHASYQLEKLREDQKKEVQMSCSSEEWMSSTQTIKENKNQEKSYSIDLDKLNNQNCAFCLEKFQGRWDSKNCKWIYENVRNFILESNDFDDPQLISIHQKCNEVLNEINA